MHLLGRGIIAIFHPQNCESNISHNFTQKEEEEEEEEESNVGRHVLV